MQTGRIIQSLSGYYDVQTADGQVFRTRARGQFRKNKEKPLVGDFVEFDSENGDGFLWAIDPRQNALVRPPIANIDLAVIVTALKEPDFNPNLLDRQLVALEAAGVPALIYFSKADLLDDQELEDYQNWQKLYQKIGYPVVMSGPKAVEELTPHLRDKVLVFMGQTGAGKSTLLNQISPELALETGEVSKALSRGKHTTRKVTLIPIPFLAALIADTPGFSSYEVFDFPVEDLVKYFPEMRAASVNCRFRACQHLNEPGCAVKEAVSLGTIAASRYNSYKLFYELMKARKPKYRKNK
ncbi:ribosome small subunit-dependent GTPase A [Eupransor demetentiae]|uniref:Small ribosomal subunit biogenesis GTPase RsgA n=1 Tax=Eupransor demetentiae TaxID=3109584 RepID=A0ABM9N4W0_9LACO|nr:Ribosome biogenesis GTPase RsgA (RsgA) [Lactobacillaceae bacterium LMG 33000]